MRDFNFFSPYIEQKSQSYNKKKPLIIAGVIIAALALAFYAFNFYRISSMEHKLKDIDAFLSNETTKASLEQYNITQQKVQILKEYQKITEDANSKIDINNKINNNLLNELTSAMPKNVFIRVLSITGSNVQLEGVASSRTAVADFVHNLKQQSLFSSVYVGNINQAGADGGGYTFTLVCGLGVVENEAK